MRPTGRIQQKGKKKLSTKIPARRTGKETAIMKAISVGPHDRGNDIPVSLKPRGLSLGLKYTFLTALAITIAALILVIISYISMRKAVENEIDASGIMLTKVLSTFNTDLWEKEGKQLKRIASDISDLMGVEIPNIINLIITKSSGDEEHFIAGIQSPEEIQIFNAKWLDTTSDDIEITEVYYSEDKEV